MTGLLLQLPVARSQTGESEPTATQTRQGHPADGEPSEPQRVHPRYGEPSEPQRVHPGYGEPEREPLEPDPSAIDPAEEEGELSSEDGELASEDPVLSEELTETPVFSKEQEVIGHVENPLTDPVDERILFVIIRPEREFDEPAPPNFAVAPEYLAVEEGRLHLTADLQEVDSSRVLTGAELFQLGQAIRYGDPGETGQLPRLVLVEPQQDQAITYGQRAVQNEDQAGEWPPEDEVPVEQRTGHPPEVRAGLPTEVRTGVPAEQRTPVPVSPDQQGASSQSRTGGPRGGGVSATGPGAQRGQPGQQTQQQAQQPGQAQEQRGAGVQQQTQQQGDSSQPRVAPQQPQQDDSAQPPAAGQQQDQQTIRGGPEQATDPRRQEQGTGQEQGDQRQTLGE